MRSAILMALALTILSTAAMATSVSQKAGMALAGPSPRKAGGCTQCACCEVLIVGGIRIPIGFGSPPTARKTEGD